MAKMDPDNIDWSLATWEGSRREQLRRWRSLSVRERLQMIEALAQSAQALSDCGGAKSKAAARKPDTDSRQPCSELPQD
jgi:CRISPR-associated protein Csx17